MKKNLMAVLMALGAGVMSAKESEPAVVPMPRPVPPGPILVVENLRADEKEIEVARTVETVASNAYYRLERTTFTFTNPNGRAMAGELQFPVPAGGAVCGYALELNGEMVPGVVTGKEAARVAFENEVRKGVDPGLVEHVKGNRWKTRIFPLNPKTPRKAAVTCLVPQVVAPDAPVFVETDGTDVFEARPVGTDKAVKAFKLPKKAWIFWDGSASFAEQAPAARKLVAKGPKAGDWQFVVFRDVPAAPVACTTREELLAAIDAVVYDGGTDLSALAARKVAKGFKKVLFSDELDTLSERAPDFAGDKSFVLPLRQQAPRTCAVRKLPADEAAVCKDVPKGTVLATAWAANRIADLSAQADARKDEFLALGRKYGVASPVTSILVLETLQQWLDNKIEPPETLAVHAEWVKRRAAEDDPIAAKRAQAEFDQRLLALWEERVKWWNDPIPPRKTPRSGVFAEEDEASPSVMEDSMPAADAVAFGGAFGGEARARRASPVARERAMPQVARAPTRVGAIRAAEAPREEAIGSAAATVSLAKWDPKMPYLEALKKAAKGEAYAAYLKQRADYAKSPAFYLDCAGWFFAAGEQALGLRILSNLSEMKLEDVALWRTRGWRLREAGVYDEAVKVFRHVLALRGEEGQSFRDLALVLTERGKAAKSVADLEEAMALLVKAAFQNFARRSTRRSNDLQVAVVALEELNGLIAWCAAQAWDGAKPKVPAFDAAFRRDLPLKLRIVMSWDADETDIDLHVLEAEGEEAYYGNRRTAAGGFVSEDVTTGYGPEEYLRKTCANGEYKVMSNYFASHQTALTGATCVTATVYTDWATAKEKRQVLTLRLDKPKDKHLIGTVKIGD